MPRDSHYQALGVQENANPTEIKKAYHSLVRNLHPDKIHGFYKFSVQQKEECQNKIARITEAYSVLSDSTQKEKYDSDPNSDAPQQAYECSVAIKQGDLATLDALYADSYTFSANDIWTAFNFKQPKVIDWLIVHNVDVNNPIYDTEDGKPVYCLQAMLGYIAAYQNFRILPEVIKHQLGNLTKILLAPGLDINRRFQIKAVVDETVIFKNAYGYKTSTARHVREYDWETNALGFALFMGDTDVVRTILSKTDASLEDILIPASGRSEKYITALELAAKNIYMQNVITARLDAHRCKNPPTVKELRNAIYNASWGFNSNTVVGLQNYAALKKLQDYRAEHYKYNIFKLGYNDQWEEKVDRSWSATFKELPNNFIQALRDAAASVKEFLYDVFNFITCGIFKAKPTTPKNEDNHDSLNQSPPSSGAKQSQLQDTKNTALTFRKPNTPSLASQTEVVDEAISNRSVSLRGSFFIRA